MHLEIYFSASSNNISTDEKSDKVLFLFSHSPLIITLRCSLIRQLPTVIEDGINVFSSFPGKQLIFANLLLTPGCAPITCSQFLKE